jgi:hypothetical protein
MGKEKQYITELNKINEDIATLKRNLDTKEKDYNTATQNLSEEVAKTLKMDQKKIKTELEQNRLSVYGFDKALTSLNINALIKETGMDFYSIGDRMDVGVILFLYSSEKELPK